MLGVQILQLDGNLLNWEKIVKVQANNIPQEDLCDEMHEKKAAA